MRTSILVSLFLTLSAPMFAFAPNAYAQSATVTVNEVKRAEAVKGEDYKMYIEAMGGVNSDALFAQYKKERAAYTANPTPVTPIPTSKVDEALKILSYKEYFYDMYLKAIGEAPSDASRKQFDIDRNAYLGTTTPTTTGEPTTPVKPQKPSATFRNDRNATKAVRRSVTKSTNPRKVIIKVIHVYQY